MLLSSLSILMGAILVPSDYLWVYSTHIILMCLYLIWTKQLIVLLLTLLSFLFVILSEFSSTPSLPIQTGQYVLVDFERNTLFYEKEKSSEDLNLPKGSVSISYFDTARERQSLNNVSIVAVKQAHWQKKLSKSAVSGEVTHIVLPDKKGAWWQKQLYINRQLAQLTVQFKGEDLVYIDRQHFSFRERLFARFDRAFDDFSSWRFSRALLLGQNDLWSERDTWVVRTLGLAHLFVVSGLHTGFMFAIGCLLSRVVWQVLPSNIMLSGITRWQCDAILIIPLLVTYAYVTGWGEPVVRASIMLSVYLFARLLMIKVSAYTIITFALWLVLLVNPRSILSPGLWLSFSMVYLLIGYCQTSTKLTKLFMAQVMLSTASMVLILGWQVSISSVSILVNIVLIPFAAFIWFPWALLSCLEVVLTGTVYAYQLLALVLDYVIRAIEWIAFHFPLLHFELFSSEIPRLLMLLLVGYWVYQSPLKRGALSAVGIWGILFLPVFEPEESAAMTLKNQHDELIATSQNRVLLSESWEGSDLARLAFGAHLNINRQTAYVLSPSDTKSLTPQQLLEHDVKWVIFKRDLPTQTMLMLEALNVNWLVIATGETLAFYYYDSQISLRHSSCMYSFFLLKSDTCKRVEKLESVLNYLQT